MNGIAHENLNKVPSVRSSATVPVAPDLNNVVYKGTAGMQVQFTETVPDSNPASTLDWLHLIDGNYVNLSDATHSGSGAYFIITQQPTTDPIPPPTDEIITITNEVNTTAKTVTTTVPQGWTGTTK